MWRDQPGFHDVQLNAVRRSIEALMPGYSGLRVRRNPLRMVVDKEGEELNVSQLSDGEKCLLALAGDLARRLALANPGLENPTQGEAIILIDEIELHLHPTWQRNAIPCLEKTFPNCQFIISTHSAPVLGHVKPEGVLLLTGRGEQMNVHRITTYGQDTNRILEEVFGAPPRPIQFEEALNKLFREIDGGALGAARKQLDKLESELGTDEPELTRARVLMHRKELIGR
jgi:predicted ATP-binding protein involved in virulence